MKYRLCALSLDICDPYPLYLSVAAVAAVGAAPDSSGVEKSTKGMVYELRHQSTAQEEKEATVQATGGKSVRT